MRGHDLVHERAKHCVNLKPITVGIIDAHLNEEWIDGTFIGESESSSHCQHKRMETHGVRVSSVIFSKRSGSTFAAAGPIRRIQFDFSKVVSQNHNNQVTQVVQSNQALEDEISEAVKAVEKLIQDNSRVINFSGYFGVGWSTPEGAEINKAAISVMRKLYDFPKRILVQSASYSDKYQLIKAPDRTAIINESARIIRRSRGIVVGSIGSDGYPDVKHSDKDSITILAPTGNFGSVEGYGHLPTSVTAASGAAPLVTLSISDVISLFPDINQEQIKVLMSKTLIPTPYGPGMINSYKMFRVAERIKQSCAHSVEMAQFIDLLLKTPRSYNFSDEVKSLKENILYDVKKSPLFLFESEWQKVRKAYLLDPNYEALEAFKSWRLGLRSCPTAGQDFRLSNKQEYIDYMRVSGTIESCLLKK